MTEGIIATPPTAKKLVIIVVSAVVVAAAIVCGAILPAEFHRDPLGIGQATGLLKLSAAKEVQVAATTTANATAAHFYDEALRSDTVDIPLAAAESINGGDELEWKVRMKAGQALVYSWTVTAPADEFYFDFHSQSDPQPEVKVMSHKAELGTSSYGEMVAPFDGIHGWYLQNQSLKPVVVHLKLSGFYTMRPDPFAAE
jgi:hypothetical protein